MKLLSPEELYEMDRNAIEKFNANPKRHPDHLLHVRAGAFVPTSNIFTAPVVMLLSNPGYSDDKAETPDLCEQFVADGWPFGHLHEEAPAGAKQWTHQRLRCLIQEFSAHFISQQVACAQLTPWASKRFHGREGLPSRSYVLEVVKKSAANGALLLVMRSQKLWAESLMNGSYLSSKNPRSAFVSPGNFQDYARIVEVLKSRAQSDLTLTQGSRGEPYTLQNS